MNTLERVAQAVAGRVEEAELHTALLLAYVQAAFGTIRAVAAPSPLYRMSFDPATGQVDFEETGGMSYVPRPQTTDISDLDLLLISNLRDIPVLFEGETGVGKTFISQAYMRTLFAKESYVSLRLSGSTFLNNVFQPFLEGRIEQGMPVTRIKQAAVDQIAALFIDEINRGDPQSILQLLDNELYNAGVFTKLGLPIPRLETDGTVTATSRKKKLLIVSAQNPASSTEAKFTGTVELDAAVDNRLLKAYFGNAARSVGSTLWLSDGSRKPFEAFKRQFASLSSEYLGVDQAVFDSLGDDWLAVYAWVTDASRTDKPVLYSALELTDMLIGVLGGELPELHAYELEIVNGWCDQLSVSIELSEPPRVTQTVEKVHELIDGFKVPFIFRDIIQIKKLADVFSTLRSLREALRAPSPVAAYLSFDKFVSVREVAEAAALLARSKQLAGSESATPLVNEVVVQYTALAEKHLEDVGYLSPKFDATDPNQGLKRLAIARAARGTLQGTGTPAAFVEALVKEANRFAQYQSATFELANVLVVKVVADLLTLAGFVTEFAEVFEEPFADCLNRGADAELVHVITRIYLDRRRSFAAVMPDVYQHRILRTVGV